MGNRLRPRCPSPPRRRAGTWWSSAKSLARAAATWLRSGEATVRKRRRRLVPSLRVLVSDQLCQRGRTTGCRVLLRSNFGNPHPDPSVGKKHVSDPLPLIKDTVVSFEAPYSYLYLSKSLYSLLALLTFSKQNDIIEERYA